MKRAPDPVTSHAQRQKPAQPRCALMCAVLASALCPLSSFAVEDAGLFDLSPDQLAKVEIKSDITSIKAKPLREQPGIVSVVTQQQIQDTGARDLSDILLQVPGFSLDSDVESMVGLTFRGLEGQEGKVLLIVDGLEINEPLYGSLPILNHIPAEAIEQVEIIRGPGSAMYGGSASLAVIRITTKGAGQNGGYVVAKPSFTGGHLSQNYSGGGGYATNDWRVSLNGSYSDTFISNQKYTSLSGTNVPMVHKSDLNPLFLDFGAGWRALEFRLIYDDYQYNDPVNYGEPPVTPSETTFNSILTSLKYDAQPTSWLKITPAFTYRHQEPWEIQSAELGNYDIVADRYQADLTAVAELSDNSGLMAGMRYFRDTAHCLDDAYDGEPASIYYNGAPSISYNDLAGFAQYDLDTRWVDLSVGGRYEYHDALGGHFVPRVALTKAWKQFHLKALYSQASRIPGINVLESAVGPSLKDEQTSDYEMEAGYRFSDSLSWVGNVFYVQVEKPIIFTSTGGVDGYYNGDKISTAGIESEVKWDRPKYSSSLGYSFYRAVDNDLDYVRGGDGTFLAAPAHKVTGSETWHVTQALDGNVNAYWISERESYAYPSAGVTSLAPNFVLNTFVNYKFKYFSAGLGVANLLDEHLYAPQPYAGGAGPLPLKGREIFARLAFKF